MIQAENNIGLTEFSNVSGHFMEAVNTPQMDFSFDLLLSYSRTSRYGHLSNTDTSILWTVSNVPTKFSYIFFKKEPQ